MKENFAIEINFQTNTLIMKSNLKDMFLGLFLYLADDMKQINKHLIRLVKIHYNPNSDLHNTI